MPAGPFDRGGVLPLRRGISVTLPGSILSGFTPSTTSTIRPTLPLSRLSISFSSSSSPSSTSSIPPSSTTSFPPSASSQSSSSSSALTSSYLSSSTFSSVPPPASPSTPSSTSSITSASNSSSYLPTSPLMSSSSTFSTSSSPSVTQSAVAALSSSHTNVGAIVGGVIGGIVVLLLAAAALFYFVRISRHVQGRNSAGDSGPLGRPGKWNGLSSRDSTMDGGLHGSHYPSRMQKAGQPQANSVGMIVPATDTSMGHGKEADTSQEQGSSEEGGISSGEEVKVNHRRSEYIETVPPLPYDRRASAVIPGSPLENSQYRRGRKPSTGQLQNQPAVALAKLHTGAAPLSTPIPATPPPARHRSVDGSMFVNNPYPSPLSRPGPASPQSPASPLSAESMQRTASGSARRNLTRKPVPSYHSNASAVGAAPPADEVAAPSTRSSTTEADVSGASTPTRNVTPSRSREDLGPKRFNVPDLNHKSSFGDARPMHYLVPDLPPSSSSRK